MLPILRCAERASRGIPRFSPTEGMGNGGRPIPYAVRCIRHPTAGYPTPTSKSKTLHRTSRPTILVGLDAECEERTRRWTLGVRSALEAGDALPSSSTAMAATPERTDRTRNNDSSHTGPTEQGGAARSAAKRRHAAGSGGAIPCAYCGRALSGHANPQPCVACRSEWPARNRALHPAELAEDLPRLHPAERWPAVAEILQFPELLEEDGPRLAPASYVTTGSHDTFEEMVRTHGSSPTSWFLLCSLFGDALGLPQGAYLDLPRPRECRAAAGHYREIFAAYGIHLQDTVLRLPNRRIYILPHVEEFLAGLDSTWEDRLTRWTLGV